MKTCRICNVEKSFSEFYAHGKTYKNQCKPCYLAKKAEYSKTESAKESNRRSTASWIEQHPERWEIINRSNQANQRAARRKARPSWYCHETVKEIYEIARDFGYEVDHIVPISKGGLHSHENLQLLTFSENRAKHNRDY